MKRQIAETGTPCSSWNFNTSSRAFSLPILLRRKAIISILARLMPVRSLHSLRLVSFIKSYYFVNSVFDHFVDHFIRLRGLGDKLKDAIFDNASEWLALLAL